MFVVCVQHDRSALSYVFEQFAFRFGDFLDRSEEFDVHRSDVRVDADVGMSEAGQPRDLSFVIHPHFADDDFGVIGRVVDAERTSDQIVEVAPRLERAALRRDQRRDHLFRRRLPCRSGDADQEKVITLADRLRQLLQCVGRISDADDPFVFGDVRRKLRNDGTARRLQSLGDELMSIETLAFDGEEDGVRFHFARIDDDGVRFDVATLNDFAVSHVGDRAHRQARHVAPRPRMQNAKCKMQKRFARRDLHPAFCILHSRPQRAPTLSPGSAAP